MWAMRPTSPSISLFPGILGELIAARKLLIGPWYTMPDVFLPDGESLIRNLARGWRDCQRWGAPFPNVGYIPDSLGHIEQIPQILRGFGIDNFEFSRGLPVALSSRPDFCREFVWQAPDGSRVIAVHLSAGYHGGMFLPPPTDPKALVARIRTLINESLAEPLDAMAQRYGKPGNAAFLAKAWKGLFHSQAHADTSYCELRDGREIIRDTNRSPWKVIHSQRDGWKRLERDRFVRQELPRRIVPFQLTGEHLALSAFKRADDGQGEVLRFWNWAEGEQTVTIGLPQAARSAAKTDLLEQPTEDLSITHHTVTLCIRPFEIVTVRWE